LIAVKNSAKTERQHRSLPEADTYHPGVLEHMLFIKIISASVEFAHDHRKFAAGIAEDGCAVHSLNAFQDKRAAGAGSVDLILVLSQAIRVPGHKRSLHAGREATGQLLFS